ncbi:MAG TPA: hypothetical protein VF461_24150 [Gemmatimonadaceae bacterium]
MISMMGAARSGKTSLLVALFTEFQNRQVLRREGWSMVANNARAQELVLKGYQRFRDKQFPESNPLQYSSALEPMRYALNRPVNGIWKQMKIGGARVETIELDLLDPSGEYFTFPEKLMLDNEEANSFRKSLIASTGLICIIDPDRADDSDYFELLFKNFTQLSSLLNPDSGGPLDIPVAICVAKADAHLAAFDAPEKFLLDTMGVPAFSTILTYCPMREFFAFSAVGRDNVERTDTGEYKLKGYPKPEGVVEPFDWLIDNEP